MKPSIKAISSLHYATTDQPNLPNTMNRNALPDRKRDKRPTNSQNKAKSTKQLKANKQSQKVTKLKTCPFTFYNLNHNHNPSSLALSRGIHALVKEQNQEQPAGLPRPIRTDPTHPTHPSIHL
jgi:hypothetical protein